MLDTPVPIGMVKLRNIGLVGDCLGTSGAADMGKISMMLYGKLTVLTSAPLVAVPVTVIGRAI